MLFMVIERFAAGTLHLVAERFQQRGRMLPEGVLYHASWLDPSGERCFQLMEAPNLEALDPWIHNWIDLVEFEVVPVLTSTEFWARRRQLGAEQS